MEVCDIVQGSGIKSSPRERKAKRQKKMYEEALQIPVKRREVKGKGETERYIHLNAEFQITARRDNKAFKGKISCKVGHNKGQKWYGPNRSRRY